MLDNVDRKISQIDVGGYFGAVTKAIGGLGGSAVKEEGEEEEEEVTKVDRKVEKGKEAPKPPNPSGQVVVAEANETNEIAEVQPKLRNQGQFMMLTKKLIEIRNILKTIDGNESLKLPSIVVIGSQSSGKSSVLEAIVGHQFLPKGTNMVTRRPIELTLIHTPDSSEEYGEFPQLGLGKIHNFVKIQKTLTDLNLAVSEDECISPTPIELKIYSANVPDLTLVDLPGYIQVVSKKQPPALKQKIQELCSNYIKEPNIILAVCAADVDLANSEALRSCRKADPLGLRTIGVVTKMDLVSNDIGTSLLENHDYPLLLGYVGVVSKSPKVSGSASDALVKTTDYEDRFFKENYTFSRPDLQVGTKTLRRKLTDVLEEYMSRNLESIHEAVLNDLEETRYQYKVLYNDRRISAETYVTEALDVIKQAFKELTNQFQKPEIRNEIRVLLEQRALDVCAKTYWEDKNIQKISNATIDDEYWRHKLEVCSSALTKSGVGRGSTQLLVDLLMYNLDQMCQVKHFKYHQSAKHSILQFCDQLLKSKVPVTVNQVENTIKPYKYEVEVTELEWANGIKRATTLLETELAMCKNAQENIKQTVGKRKLNAAIKCIMDRENEEKEDSEEILLPARITPEILENARESIKLRQRALVLRYRLAALRSRQCRSSENKALCPEAFLSVVTEKLVYTASMFIQVELLNELYYQFPRQVDNMLYYGVSKEHMSKFAKENPDVAKQLELLERKMKLEEVMEKLKYLSRTAEEMRSSQQKKMPRFD